MRKLSYTIVDVFTSKALAGNPLCVFTNGTGLETELMQALARETNLSETVFLQRAEGDETARVRIFTPRTELPFAGHPLVGTAYVLARSTPVPVVRLLTGVGPIDIEIERNGGFVTRCVMTQPEPTFAEHDPAPVAAALGVPVTGPVVLSDNGVTSLLAPVADVDSLTPDLTAVALLGHALCAFGPPAGDTVPCRVFAPAYGIPEDPATGSIAGPLARHVVDRGLVPAGEVVIEQGRAMGRPSVIETEIGAGPPRVGGACVPVARGFFELPG